MTTDDAGAYLRARRTAARLSQTALGRLSGDSQSYIANMEAGRATVQARVLEAIKAHQATASAEPRAGRPRIDAAERERRKAEGGRLRAKREAKGLSQGRLGTACGVSDMAISKWERGRAPIPPAAWTALEEECDDQA